VISLSPFWRAKLREKICGRIVEFGTAALGCGRVIGQFGLAMMVVITVVLIWIFGCGIISSNDLPATLQRVFPGRFLGQTLQEVREDC
jgi:hypothetical protein